MHARDSREPPMPPKSKEQVTETINQVIKMKESEMGEQMRGYFSSVSRALWGLGQLFSLKGQGRKYGGSFLLVLLGAKPAFEN